LLLAPSPEGRAVGLHIGMQDRWGEAPLVAVAVCLSAGIAVSAVLHQYIFAALAIAAGAFAAAAWLSLRDDRLLLCLGLGLCALAADGVLLGLAARDGLPLDDVHSLLARGQLSLGNPVLLEGCVAEDPTPRGPDLATVVDLRGMRVQDAWIQAGGKVQLRVATPADPQVKGAVLKWGDRVRVWADCDIPRNFQNPGSADRVGLLARRGICLLGRVKAPQLVEVLPNDCGNPWGRAAASVRRSLRDRIHRLGEEGDSQRAAVLSSIVLGDYTNLSTETRTEFQETGTIHVLVVSGLHVGWIVWLLSRAFQLMRLPAGVARMLAACAILFYASLVGFQASISRALWMFGLYMIGQSIFRRASPVNTVFACAFLLLSAHPGWLLDAGFQLSFLSVTAIVLTGTAVIEGRLRPLLEPLRHAGNPERLFFRTGGWHSLGRWLRFRAEVFAEDWADRYHASLEHIILRGSRAGAGFSLAIASMIVISLSVQAWIEPALAYYFNRLSWVAPAANLAVVPLASLVLVSGLAAEAATSITLLAYPVFRIAGCCSALLRLVNNWFSELPGAWQRCPTPPLLWVITGITIVFLWCFHRWRRLWIPFGFVSLEIACLSLASLNSLPQGLTGWIPSARNTPGWADARLLRLSFLDVGQGDSMVIQFPDHRVWVIDAGGLGIASQQDEDANSFDTGEALVSRFLWSRWIARLDRAILTHPHHDHAGGMPTLLRNFPTGRLDYGDAGNEPGQARVLEAARSAAAPIHAVVAGEQTDVAGVAVRVLSPVGKDPFRSLNDGSVVLRLRFGRFSALFAGDLESSGEAEVLSREPQLRGLLLKVGHHGSRSATSDRFLERVQPRWAVISAGRRNPFLNPSPETMLRLLRHGARPLLTMDQGAVFMETDGIHYTLRSYTLGVLEQGVLPDDK
jgi:competence protein ComEC